MAEHGCGCRRAVPVDHRIEDFFVTGQCFVDPVLHRQTIAPSHEVGAGPQHNADGFLAPAGERDGKVEVTVGDPVGQCGPFLGQNALALDHPIDEDLVV